MLDRHASPQVWTCTPSSRRPTLTWNVPSTSAATKLACLGARTSPSSGSTPPSRTASRQPPGTFTEGMMLSEGRCWASEGRSITARSYSAGGRTSPSPGIGASEPWESPLALISTRSKVTSSVSSDLVGSAHPVSGAETTRSASTHVLRTDGVGASREIRPPTVLAASGVAPRCNKPGGVVARRGGRIPAKPDLLHRTSATMRLTQGLPLRSRGTRACAIRTSADRPSRPPRARRGGS